jgi:hypothetical protein
MWCNSGGRDSYKVSDWSYLTSCYITSQETVIVTALVPDCVGRLCSKSVTCQRGELLRYVVSKSVFLSDDVITGGMSWIKSQLNAGKMWPVDPSTVYCRRELVANRSGTRWVNNAVITSYRAENRNYCIVLVPILSDAKVYGLMCSIPALYSGCPGFRYGPERWLS